MNVDKLNSKTASSRRRPKPVTEAPQPKRRKVHGSDCFSYNTSSSEVQRKANARQSDVTESSETTNNVLITGRDVRYKVYSMSVLTAPHVLKVVLNQELQSHYFVQCMCVAVHLYKYVYVEYRVYSENLKCKL